MVRPTVASGRAIALIALVVIAGCGGGDDPHAGMSIVPLAEAIEREGGLAPLVADMSGIVPDGIQPDVKENGGGGLVHGPWIVAAPGRGDEPAAELTIATPECSVRHDERVTAENGLARWLERRPTIHSDGRPPSVAVEVDGGCVEIASATLAADQLRVLAARVGIAGNEPTLLDGWTVMAPPPTEYGGYLMLYPDGDGFDGLLLVISAGGPAVVLHHRVLAGTADRELDLGLDVPVFQVTPVEGPGLVEELRPLRTVVFAFDADRAVMLSGHLSDDAIRQIVTTMHDATADDITIWGYDL